MAVELEWRFKDEVPNSVPQDQKEPRPRRPSRRRWLGLGGAALLLIGVGLYARWRVRREALAAVEAEVRSVAQLEMRALAERDAELYLSLQDEAALNWQEAQQARAALDALFPPPLPSLTATSALSIADARVVGDTARVETVRMAGLPGEEMVPFRAIRFYRRSEDGRWLHTAVDLDYAAQTVVLAGQRVVITSFAPDAERMRPVAARLESLGDRFCSLAACQRRPPLALVFTGTLGTAVEPEGVLPAPFLVGAPDDDAARAAWETGLRELLFDRLTAREMGSPVSTEDQPHTGAFFRARLREWLRAKLGLREPIPLDLDLIGEALDAGEWIGLGTLWYMDPTDDDPRRPLAEAQVDLLLAFIEDNYGPPAVASLLPGLREARWIGTVVEKTLDEEWLAFEHRYAAYALEALDRSAEFADDGVSAFAAYDLVAACGWPSSLWGLRLDRLEMTPLSGVAGFDDLSWSPDGARLLAWRWEIDGGKAYLLEADGSGVGQLTGVPPEARPAGWSPTSSHVAYSTASQPSAGGLVDVETGESAALGGHFSAWSPDGSHLAYITFEAGPPRVWLAQRDGSSPRQVGVGDQATWSPNGTQIAFSGMYDDESLLKIYDVSTEETTILLDRPTLYDLLGIEFEQAFVGVNSLAWSPSGEWIGFGVGQVDGMESVSVKGGVLLVHPDSSDLHAPLTREAGAAVTGWSPDGRWLTGYIYNPEQFTTTVISVDGTALLRTNAAVAWSPDGRYLAVGEMDGLRILEVENGTWRSFESPARCEIVAWNPRAPLHELAPGTGGECDSRRSTLTEFQESSLFYLRET
jgi:hypothetical protein